MEWEDGPGKSLAVAGRMWDGSTLRAQRSHLADPHTTHCAAIATPQHRCATPCQKGGPRTRWGCSRAARYDMPSGERKGRHVPDMPYPDCLPVTAAAEQLGMPSAWERKGRHVRIASPSRLVPECQGSEGARRRNVHRVRRLVVRACLRGAAQGQGRGAWVRHAPSCASSGPHQSSSMRGIVKKRTSKRWGGGGGGGGRRGEGGGTLLPTSLLGKGPASPSLPSSFRPPRVGGRTCASASIVGW